ncbi:aldolase/citrate lyase family protein [Bosea sp. (in: a-proteobacteria)]|uniref:HpcH/HpaI aldolase family protein n=1 Tax=Bosea sp. (in: a-proteobacteria) TaxID=1871050 RepID=UPI0033408DC8
MKLPSNKFLASIRSGQPQIGLWLSLASGYATEAVAGAGFDWLLIDTEHSPNDLNAVMTQLQVLAAHPVTPIVRPDWNDTVLVKRLLDIGAPGLLCPMVQTPDEAAQAVAATRYPPRGVRGVSGCNRANGFARMSDYFSRVEEETAVLVQVETRAAIEQVLQIGQVDGVDGVFFGPSDIAADLGLLGKPNDPAVWEVIRPAARKLMDAGIPVGTLVFDPGLARSLLGEGFSFVACGSDMVLLARGADALLRGMKA